MATKEVSTVNSTNYLIISDNDQNQVIINQPNNNIIQVTIPSNANNITQNENIVVVNDPSSKQINIIDQGVRVIQLTALGPQGPQGAPGSSLPFYQSGSANIWITTASLQISNLVDINGSLIITGSLIISGSNTFNNIGTGLFTGSLLVTGSAFYNGREILTTEITGGLVPTSSFNAFTSSFNTFTSSYSTGSFTGSFTGSLLGTSSYSNQSLSSSYALTASFALNAGTTVDTGSFATTSSFNAFTSSINTATSSFVTNSQTGSFTTTSSFTNFTSSYSTGSFTGSFTGLLFGTSSQAITASNTVLQNTILTNQTVGALTSGTTLPVGTGLESILRTMLITYIPPTLSALVMRNEGSNILTAARDVGDSFTTNTASFSATADNPAGIFPISSSWTASGADGGTQTFYFGDNVLSTSNVRSVGSVYTITRATLNGTVTFTVNGRRSDTGAGVTAATTSLQFQWRNYLAASSTIPTSNATAQTVVNTSVTSALDTDRAWTATCTAANDTIGNFTYVIYPASYGNLSNIIQNGALSVLSAFTNLGDFTITNAFGASISVRIYKSNSDKAFASGTTLAIS